MFNSIKKIAITIGAGILFAGHVYAATLSVRIEQPKSPTNQNDFTINFVSLDISPSPAAQTATCFKKSTSDGGFSQMGGTIGLSAGGNSANCTTGSSVISTSGTYQFYVSVTNGAQTAISATVSVDYNNSGPGTPINWSKEKIDENTYKIHFKSADDAGKTVKVDVYRSDQTSFNLDDGTVVGSVSIGSNTDADFTNDVPDPSKTYYYAVRAFDSSGNGSGVLGDSETHLTTISPTTTTAGGAIPVSAAAAGTILGTGTEGRVVAGITGATGVIVGEGTVLGEEISPAATPTTSPPKPATGFWSFLGPLGSHPWLVSGGVLAFLALLFFIFFH